MAVSDNFQGLSSQTSSNLYETGFTKIAAGFAGAYGANINYNLLKASLTNQSILANAQAMGIETQAIERANIMRQNFNQAAGSQIQNAAARNIKVNSGMVSNSLMRSAMGMGSDIQKMTNNAKRQAEALRFNAWANTKIAKIRGKAQMVASYMNSASQIISGGKDIADASMMGV